MMGKVIMSGIVPQLVAPSVGILASDLAVGILASDLAVGILASDLAVGSSVYLVENGSPVEYMVVHQGRPSTVYDASCDGTWLLRKEANYMCKIGGTTASPSNVYASSVVDTYLTGTFFNTFDSNTQSIIKQVKIPHCPSYSSVSSGSNGLSRKVFILSCSEVGYSTSYVPADGATLSYFADGSNSKRIAYFNGNANGYSQSNGAVTSWWLRSPFTKNTINMWRVYSSGTVESNNAANGNAVRPALILPSTALFDEETLILKGVA